MVIFDHHQTFLLNFALRSYHHHRRWCSVRLRTFLRRKRLFM